MKIVGQRTREFFRLVDVFDEESQRFVPQTRLDFIHALDRAQVERIGRQPIKRIRGHAQNLPRLNLLGGIFD